MFASLRNIVINALYNILVVYFLVCNDIYMHVYCVKEISHRGEIHLNQFISKEFKYERLVVNAITKSFRRIQYLNQVKKIVQTFHVHNDESASR